MFAGLSDVWRAAGQHLVFTLITAALIVWLAVVQRQARGQALERRRERRIFEELEAYACLDTRLGPGQDLAALSLRVCQVVAEKSHFLRVAVLARNEKGRLYVAGSVGMEKSVVDALGAWAGCVAEPTPESALATPRSSGRLRSALCRGIDVGARSLAVVLGTQHGRAIVIPFATTGDRRLMGAIVVCAERMLSVRRKLVDEAVAPLEILAIKLGSAMENAALSERLIRAEKLAGLGLLAGGVAHALNNPLTAVLGFAELIAETVAQPRVQEDAETIVQEAQHMRGTVESLLNLWHPSVNRDEAIDVAGLVYELAEACEAKLAARGVQLVLQTGNGAATVRGNRDRLRQVMEYLLNNAAQAIATRAGSAHAIRISITHDSRTVQLIVSDTGPGFREPGRVFDPFYTNREPGEGAGLGLSICYGIVREHNGEITAFNLYPNGAAVMVELPIGSPNTIAPEAFLGEVA